MCWSIYWVDGGLNAGTQDGCCPEDSRSPSLVFAAVGHLRQSFQTPRHATRITDIFADKQALAQECHRMFKVALTLRCPRQTAKRHGNAPLVSQFPAQV